MSKILHHYLFSEVKKGKDFSKKFAYRFTSDPLGCKVMILASFVTQSKKEMFSDLPFACRIIEFKPF